MTDQTGDVGARLRADVEQLRSAIEVAGDRLDPEIVRTALSDLERVVARLDIGVDHAVVALVGGTGSGKSSTFNALTTLDFADVGVIRPTTSRAAACVWGEGADPLLDFLGVEESRRIQRESALTGSDEADLRGLVLLDMPDHDSVEVGHAALVDRLLPVIDLLIWVVDPQKYADNALHEGYLRELRDRHDAMIVVINQIDTLTDAGKESVREDVRRLLIEDDLADLEVIPASAHTGQGIAQIRTRLRQIIDTESVAARTARTEITAIARRLSAGLGADSIELPAPTQTAAAVVEAAGVPAVAASIETAVASPGQVALSPVQRPARSRIDAIRGNWLSAATASLPPRWRDALVSSVASAERFHDSTTAALESAAQPSATDTAAARMRVAGLLLCWLALVLALGAGALVLLEQDAWAIIAAAGGAVLFVLIGVILLLAARARRRATAERRARSYEREIDDAVEAVVRAELVEPAREVLATHAQVRRDVYGAMSTA